MGHSGAICFTVATSGGFPPRSGGLALAAHRVSRYLADAGFDVHVVTCSPDAITSSTVEDRLTVHRLAENESPFKLLFAFQHFLRHLDSEVHFDLFHGFFLSSVPPSMAVAATPKNGSVRPVIATIRGSDAKLYFPNPYLGPLLVSALGKSNCWVTSVNETYLNYVAERVRIEGRSSVIRNSAPVLNRNWRLGEDNFGVIGCSGEFRKVKDIPLLVRAYRKIVPRLRRRLLLVGAFTDPLEDRWSRTLLEEAGLAGELELTGFLPHPEAIAQLARMHVYVQSSAFEGLPNALLEAAASGVPIIATAVGGIREIFTHGVDAMLVPHADPVALAQAIEQVLDDPDLALRLSENAAKLCRRFSREREKDEWVALHHRLIADVRDGRTAVGAASR